MMSIGLAAAVRAATTLPVPLPTTGPVTPPLDPTEASPWLVAALVAWGTFGLIAARWLGAFRRRGICGPERLGETDSAWPLLGVIGGGFVALFACTTAARGVVGGIFTALRADPTDDVRNLLVGALGEAMAAAAVVALIWEFWASDHAGIRLAGLRPRGIPNALAGGTAALFILFPLIQLAGLVVVQVYRWLHLTQAKPHPVLEMMRSDHRPALAIAAVLTASLVAPVAEELAFRGLIQTMLGRLVNWLLDGVASSRPGHQEYAAHPPARPVNGVTPLSYATPPPPSTASPLRPVSRWIAVIVTSMAFAAIHGEPAFLAPIFVLSVGLGFVYERSGNLYMNIVTHSLFNTAQIVMFLAFGG